MKKYLVFFCLMGLTVLKAAEDYIESTSAPGFKNFLARNYYQNASIVGVGTSPRSTHQFLLNTLANDTTFEKDCFDEESYRYSFFYRPKNDKTEVVLLPILYKEAEYFEEIRFDGNQTLKKCQDLTLKSLEKIYERFNKNVMIHMLTAEFSNSFRETKPNLTSSRDFINKQEAMNINRGHLTYTQLTLNENENAAINFDPSSQSLWQKYILNAHEVKSEKFKNLTIFREKIKLKYIYRADQCCNMHDCGRFSIIYLMHSLKGNDIQNLSGYDIYKGFKKWIESENGLLSYQQHIDIEGVKALANSFSQERNKLFEDFNKKIQGREKLFEDFNKNIQEKYQLYEDLMNNIKKKYKSYADLNKYYQEIDKLREDLSKHDQEKNKLFEDINKDYLEFIEKCNDFDNEYLKKVALYEKSQPSIKKTWMATFTSIGRKVIDILLSYF